MVWSGTRWGVAKLVKAPDFDSGMRGFESFLPSPIVTDDDDAAAHNEFP